MTQAPLIIIVIASGYTFLFIYNFTKFDFFKDFKIPSLFQGIVDWFSALGISGCFDNFFSKPIHTHRNTQKWVSQTEFRSALWDSDFKCTKLSWSKA